ncbi:succinylglutamate desuccinylase/aspartoacylase family protein [Thalassotalea ponticola]|uniref:succinylglutamate desuccinylase/aspartoacylase domain-containing protein n=1 Tax=Thalassotalea ponticola TaxID=1523392 RepID=UPI0025B5317A|nr:succinylglutamate desuccinylase/aspartoacylase family protein [Thalassotalea ponticola]MDN3651583.1 succinylglutamate desuccinylase/aspartoacylase family protein [Thalassotalea ponticola]
MAVDFSDVCFLKDPGFDSLKSDYEQFLLSLYAPTVIDISGRDQSRTRVVTTLIHGNEPSGLIAMHRYLTQLHADQRPITNLRFIICSIEAASASPRFSHRYLPDGLDLNRCFGYHKQPAGYYLRARQIEHIIEQARPEVVVDLHNTSGYSPAFAVSVMKNEMALSLAAVFCRALVLSHIRLGALMEQDFGCEAITIECGGNTDSQAHEVAYLGLVKLATLDDLSAQHINQTVTTYLNPLRLQLADRTALHFAKQDFGLAGVTLCDNIEQYNFGQIYPEQMLGWVDTHGLNNLQLLDASGVNVVNDYFQLRGNQLVPKQAIHVFMATKNSQIAKSDCLFYLVSHKNQLT